ncbi:hypothetical protein GobsT_54080 [Gemmata obscuriglobus]|nr:hypothetical protein GobsT_54080 [Gemmata obscuriglobus]VTS09927.1 unnamed protein product [Gemmata obscuriglobus UQM 2246]
MPELPDPPEPAHHMPASRSRYCWLAERLNTALRPVVVSASLSRASLPPWSLGLNVYPPDGWKVRAVMRGLRPGLAASCKWLT